MESPQNVSSGATQLTIDALTDIFQSSMDSVEVEPTMKKAFIMPIWKGGDWTLPSAYWPVALTTHLSKVMERMVRAELVAFLEANRLMDASQHGARGGRSTLSQLLVQHEHVLRLLEDGGNVDIIYLDFAKAFDKVDLSILLRKIQKLGVTGPLGRWLANFLAGRTQAVRVGAGLSSWAQVVSGVPQGSVLGPLLFLIFIADLGAGLPSGSPSLLLKYVDDSKLIHPISSPEDVEELQESLEALYSWQASNNMMWNGAKFVALWLGLSEDLKQDTLLFTPEVEAPITPFPHTKDLGVIVDAEASFRPQRLVIVQKVKAKAAWALRTFRSREPRLMRTLWRTVVQPHQDYASQLWAPSGLLGDIQLQEGPQRAFTKRVRGLHTTPYWERLAALNLLSVERRQEHYRILYVWKALKGLVPECGVSADPLVGPRRGLMARIPPLSGSRARIQTLKDGSFQHVGPQLFNCLPGALRTLEPSLASFKAKLDLWLAGVRDLPWTAGRPHQATDLQGRPSNSLLAWSRQEGFGAPVLPWVQVVSPLGLLPGEWAE